MADSHTLEAYIHANDGNKSTLKTNPDVSPFPSSFRAFFRVSLD
jgi:hypothetical protein